MARSQPSSNLKFLKASEGRDWPLDENSGRPREGYMSINFISIGRQVENNQTHILYQLSDNNSQIHLCVMFSSRRKPIRDSSRSYHSIVDQP